MNIQQDFKELLELLERNNVEYMIVDGVSFTEVKGERIRGRYGDTEVSFIGKDHLLKNKKSTKKTKDKADVEELL